MQILGGILAIIIAVGKWLIGIAFFIKVIWWILLFVGVPLLWKFIGTENAVFMVSWLVDFLSGLVSPNIPNLRITGFCSVIVVKLRVPEMMIIWMNAFIIKFLVSYARNSSIPRQINLFD